MKWEIIYVKPPLSAEDSESVPLVFIRVLWGQQAACVTRVSFSLYHRNPEEPDTQPKITHGIRAVAVILVYYILTSFLLLLLLLFLKKALKCLLKVNSVLSAYRTRRRDQVFRPQP